MVEVVVEIAVVVAVAGLDLDMWRPLGSLQTIVETHPTLEYQTIKGDKTYVEDPLVVESRGQLSSLPSPKTRS